MLPLCHAHHCHSSHHKQHVGRVSWAQLQVNLVQLGYKWQSPAPLLLREGSDMQSPGHSAGPGLSYLTLSRSHLPTGCVML